MIMVVNLEVFGKRCCPLHNANCFIVITEHVMSVETPHRQTLTHVEVPSPTIHTRLLPDLLLL